MFDAKRLLNVVAESHIAPDAKDVHIAADGTVSAGGASVGTLLVVNADAAALVPEGDHMRPVEGTPLAEAMDPMLRTGALEKPNFDVVEGMVDLIRTSRTYECVTTSSSAKAAASSEKSIFE